MLRARKALPLAEFGELEEWEARHRLESEQAGRGGCWASVEERQTKKGAAEEDGQEQERATG